MTTHIPPQLFPDPQLQTLLVSLDALNDQQKLWLSGYLAGGIQVQPAAAGAGTSSGPTITIVFGTETNNCRTLAQNLAERCRAADITAEVVDMAGLRVRKLSRYDCVVVITATHGDGDPPEPAADFYETLMADDAPQFKGLQFAVLALGDSSYEQFCVTGQQIDQRLESLGGKRLLARRDCDVDFQQPAEAWFAELLPLLPASAANVAATVTTTAQPAALVAQAGQSTYSKTEPLLVEVLANHNLSSAQRPHPNHHVVLELPVEDFPLQPGDAIGVLPENPPELVAAILDHTGLSGEQPVTWQDAAMPLVEALRAHCDLTIPGRNLLTLWAELCADQDSPLHAVAAGSNSEQRSWLKQNQIVDIVRRYPARPQAQALVEALRPLQPRLYDVANSLAVVDDELHLTVKAFTYPFGEREENGITSRFLLELQPGDSLQIYPHRNARFQLPEDPAAPLILIAEGTGIAPYRAFLQELSQRDAVPPCWLVFAEDHFEEDFLYQLDLQQALTKGQLQQLDTVFYADQPDTELATPLLRDAAQLAEWLERGGHLYLGGDKASLEHCEAQLSACLDERLGAGYWQTLTKAKRVHRNLY